MQISENVIIYYLINEGKCLFEVFDMFEQFDRITHDPEVMGGKACIRGMRMTVGMILMQISEGCSIDELLDNYPYLEREDVMQALAYAAWAVGAKEELVVPA